VQTAAALADSLAERLDAIIRTSVDGIIVINARGQIDAFNPGAEPRVGEIPPRGAWDPVPCPVCERGRDWYPLCCQHR
jgi:PAS domain-containing protein